MTRTATWKQTERAVARALGGRRVGPSGRATPDVDAGWLVVECKHRASLPAWLKAALAQARQAAGPNRLGVAVLHECGARHAGDLVVLTLGDWLDWFGPVDGAGVDGEVLEIVGAAPAVTGCNPDTSRTEAVQEPKP